MICYKVYPNQLNRLKDHKNCITANRLWAVSLFSWSVKQNARDTQMTMRVTEGTRRERHNKRETTYQPRENGLSRSSDFLAWKLKCWRARKRDLRVCLNNRGFPTFLFLKSAAYAVHRVRVFSGCRPCSSHDAQCSRARTLPLLNLKKKRDWSQSTLQITGHVFWSFSNGMTQSIWFSNWNFTFSPCKWQAPLEHANNKWFPEYAPSLVW